MDSNQKPKDPSSLVIKADDEIAKGRFANLAQVGSTQDAFVFDFAFVQGKQGFLLARLLMSPQHAKRFSMALSETIAKHEARYGEIDAGPTLQ
ncbi:MAG: DUF3467 domain-containing protein [Myxococcales bacterium]|nr:DUF3467 domain-containing protein [Myxococcales bacterium]MDD9972241.1 DUF3467 domain-containing protein [Myxococcales bacterium]